MAPPAPRYVVLGIHRPARGGCRLRVGAWARASPKRVSATGRRSLVRKAVLIAEAPFLAHDLNANSAWGVVPPSWRGERTLGLAISSRSRKSRPAAIESLVAIFAPRRCGAVTRRDRFRALAGQGNERWQSGGTEIFRQRVRSVRWLRKNLETADIAGGISRNLFYVKRELGLRRRSRALAQPPT